MTRPLWLDSQLRDREQEAARAWLTQNRIRVAGTFRATFDEHYPGGWNQFLTDQGLPLGER